MPEEFNNDKMNFDAALARGSVLNSVTMLEKIIDIYISTYYSQKGKQNQFFRIFMSRTEFKRKIDIFKETVIIHQPNFKKDYPSYLDDLRKIIDSRNIFAHEVLDISQDGMINYNKGSLQFDNFKKDRKKNTFNDLEINSLRELIHKYSEIIKDLLSK